MNEDQWTKLHEAAVLAQKKAYAPYSGYQVGAALLTQAGQIFSGTNVENASFGATVCAERHAVGMAILSGPLKIAGLVVCTKDASPPCGLCRQVLSEFGDDFPIRIFDAQGKQSKTSFKDIFPGRLKPENFPNVRRS